MIQNSLYIICTTLILTLLSYLFLDKHVSLWIYIHFSSNIPQAHRFVHMPETFTFLAVIYYIYYALRVNSSKAIYNIENCLLLATLALTITAIFKDVLKFICGRTWPLPWLGNNPSLISTHTYGFFWFHGGRGFEAFPSGHMAVTAAVLFILYSFYPKYRTLWLLLSVVVASALMLMNFHFISDIIAGAGLGILIGYWTYNIGKKTSQ